MLDLGDTEVTQDVFMDFLSGIEQQNFRFASKSTKQISEVISMKYSLNTVYYNNEISELKIEVLYLYVSVIGYQWQCAVEYFLQKLCSINFQSYVNLL